MPQDEHLTRIESDLSHQARLNEQLSEVVFTQSQQIDALAELVRKMETRLAQIEQSLGNRSPVDNTAEEPSPWKDPEM